MTRKATVGLLIQTLVWGVVFTAWGWDDWRGFLVHPARAGLVAMALITVAAVLAWRLDVQPFRKSKQGVGRQRWLLATLMLMGLGLMAFLPYGDRREVLTFSGADGSRYFGLLLNIGGNILAFVALRALGKQYSGYVTLQEDHRLVQTGIYGAIRHPIYLRALMVFVGLPLIFRSWLFLPLFVVGVLFVGYRIRQEEKLLAEHFGAEFEAYRRRTWRLLPYLY